MRILKLSNAFWTCLSTLVISTGISAAEPPATPNTEVRSRGSAQTFKNISPDEFEKLRAAKTNIVLDVRTAKEFASGHIPGAIHIDVNSPDFEKKITSLNTNRTYLVHCGAGVRSAKACEKMGKLNFPHLFNLDGGMKAWEKAGNKPQK